MTTRAGPLVTAGDEFALKAVPGNADPVVTGARNPAVVGAFGIPAPARRAIMKATDPVLEGAHLAPGLAEPEGAVVVSFLVAVDDEALHRLHTVRRVHRARRWPMDRGLEHPTRRRAIRRPVRSLAPSRPPVRGPLRASDPRPHAVRSSRTVPRGVH